ncbi:signal transduction histidine kinase [Natranaerovirga pectinivora]|uniref:histidine kinase n=1 Tax=Natranaerovirga pectinivora TaxID=682400 RepID=A0A4R3MHA2_9FIRM|nr:sensor histidine kinase [Natranaerovirga pectinivora]TCT13107.1 signal transduction histidine kinase [Natranaerovirga pectinivora]
MSKRINVFFVFLVIFNIVLFYFALNLENASVERHRILVGLFVFHLCALLLRVFIFKRHKLYIFLLMVSLGIVIALELQSKFVVNYFFHFFYVFIILEGAYFLSLKKSSIINIIALFLSMTKYIHLLSIDFNYRNLIEAVFFFLINGLIIVTTAFAKYYVEEKQKAEKLYSELLMAHERLRAYSDEIKDLTVVKERNRIARDLHDTLGHSMTGIIMQLELAENFIEKDIEKAKGLIIKTKEGARDSLKQVRMAVDTLKEKEEVMGLDSIRNLIDNFMEQTEVGINFGVLGKERALSPEVYVVLYRVIQEGLTNCVRHGKASGVDVKITFSEACLFLYVEDNGGGCENLILGNGLMGMKERVFSVGGEVVFRSGVDGFKIKVSIPV